MSILSTRFRRCARLPKVLADKVSLIVLDDVWFAEQVAPFLNALGPRCRLLITTRDGGPVTALGAQELPMEVLGDEEALALVAEWAAQPTDTVPQEARDVALECGNLALALAMAGALVRDNPNGWANAHKLCHADLGKIKRQFPNYPHRDLLRAIQISVDTLEGELRARYFDLAVFPEDTPIPEVALQTLWAQHGLEQIDTQDMLDLFALHGQLVRAHQGRCTGGWASGPDDG